MISVCVPWGRGGFCCPAFFFLSAAEKKTRGRWVKFRLNRSKFGMETSGLTWPPPHPAHPPAHQTFPGPLVSQEHCSCAVHDSEKSVVLLNARVDQILGWWASSCKSCSHAALCQTVGAAPDCSPGTSGPRAERQMIRLERSPSLPPAFALGSQ